MLFVQTEPFLFVSDQQSEGNVMLKGFCADLARKISENIGFSYKITPVRDGLYGSKKDGSSKWNGMVGELIRHVSGIDFRYTLTFSYFGIFIVSCI